MLKPLVREFAHPKSILICGLLVFSSCATPPPPVEPPPPPKPEPVIVVFMVDRSGSFHKVQKAGNFKDKDYFVLACDQIKDYVKKVAGTEPQLIIVRTIESASFTTETGAAKLDLTNSVFTFEEKEPNGA